MSWEVSTSDMSNVCISCMQKGLPPPCAAVISASELAKCARSWQYSTLLANSRVTRVSRRLQSQRLALLLQSLFVLLVQLISITLLQYLDRNPT